MAANGKRYTFTSGSTLVLPWRHEIVYEADHRAPYLIAGVHIVSDHEPTSPVRFGVAHQASDRLYAASERHDIPISGLETVRFGTLSSVPALSHMGECCVLMFNRMRDTTSLAYTLGNALLETLVASVDEMEAGNASGPVELRAMVQWVEQHLSEQQSLADLCTISGLCPSTVGRMFRKHLNTTPVTYIARRKVAYARGLLATTSMTVSEIGRRAGIDDVAYFSKLFRKHQGMSPLAFRRHSALVG